VLTRLSAGPGTLLFVDLLLFRPSPRLRKNYLRGVTALSSNRPLLCCFDKRTFDRRRAWLKRSTLEEAR